jgi:hypothetical protein
MIPSELHDLPTLAEVLEERRQPAEPLYQCPTCPRILPPDNLVWTVGLPGALPAFVCHTCASGPHREALADLAAAERAAAGPDWSGVRARRSQLLAMCDWTQAADSPLSDAQREEWRAYRQALRDLTETTPSPDAVVWPSAPG